MTEAIIVAWIAIGLSFLSAVIYAIQAYFNRKQVKVSQEQVKVSQEQTRISQQQLDTSLQQTTISQEQTRISQQEVDISMNLITIGQLQAKTSHDQLEDSREQVYALSRPLLIPLGPQDLRSPQWEAINIRNAGLGVALNIRGAVFGMRSDNTRTVRNLWFPNPLIQGESPITVQNSPQIPKLTGDCRIVHKNQTYEFNAPKRSPEELKMGLRPVTMRLVLTYHDLFGRKHASIFDRTHLVEPH